MLGPLEVWAGGCWTGVDEPKRRALLAALLASSGRVVPVEQLIDELWGDDPPSGARKLVSNHVSRLRRFVGDLAGDVVVTRAPGYLLCVSAADVDAGRFEELLAEGRAALADGQADRAAQTCAEALALWQGPALADVPRALDGAGRPAEALAAYEQARQVIATELGADPGHGLQQLHRRLLAGDGVTAAVTPGARTTREAAPAVPRQIPGPVRHFVGRADEMRRLSRLLDEAAGGSAMVISAIDGTAGVGKTALAVHWAHQVSDNFPDGQLYVNLRGYDPDQPVAAADALAGFLRALGVPGSDVPVDADERAALYRSLLAGRRVLVVLDNASEVDQVRPLLPGSLTCVTVVTSRDSLSGLVARDGATRLDLGLLSHAEAVNLLRALIGERAGADPAATQALADQCCRLPLVLRVAAEFAAARPAASLSDLVDELNDQQRRLELLDAGGDQRTAPQAVFAWSYQHLDLSTARTFRLLSLHPGPDLDIYAAAAITAATLDETSRELDRLVRAHLVQFASPGRYSMHDLLRSYASEQANAQDGEEEVRAAATRVFDHYLHAAAVAMDVLYPAERQRRPRPVPPVTPSPPLTRAAAAREWLESQRATLVAVAAHTAARGWPSQAIALSATLFGYLQQIGAYPDAYTVHTCAWRAAQQTGDRAAEAAVLNRLGIMYWGLGQFEQAAGHLEHALSLSREISDLAGEARTLCNLGLVDITQGRHETAARHLRQALAMHDELGDRLGQTRTLGNLGSVEARCGRYLQAAGHYREALAIARDIGDQPGEARTLMRLGSIELNQGRYEAAADYQQRAIGLFRELCIREGEAQALAVLGDVESRRGWYQQAAQCQRQSLATYRELGERPGEARALNGLGEALLGSGQPGQAHMQFAAALNLASETDHTYAQARAHYGLGRAYRALGDISQAGHHLREALTSYTGLGDPTAEEVRAELRTVEQPGAAAVLGAMHMPDAPMP
ncbi:MAG TPA: tetratricopeptide repeat protein [Streptosporangiaceae bacterium]|nr:tetratricopeptide repeat protein [Streptosporangiaceae bacterium]